MIHKKDFNWIRLCRKLMVLSTHRKYQLACVVVKSNRVISIGINAEFKGSKKYLKKHRTHIALHAEVDALHGKSKESTKGCTLYIAGQTVAGNPIVSKPCSTCLLFISQMGIKKVVYDNIKGLEEIKKDDLPRLVDKVTYLAKTD